MQKKKVNVREFNRAAWDLQVAHQNRWTIPVSPTVIEAARQGEWSIFLTPTIPVPHHWFPKNLKGKDVLCLASGGGQQAPILAAVGANVTVFDNSPAQLARDQEVADREGLDLQVVEGDMCNLEIFQDKGFDLIVHPVSNVFIPDVLPLWREGFRVLRDGGILMAGFNNPDTYIFDWDLIEAENRLMVKHSLPYSDLENYSEEQIINFAKQGRALEFSHTLEAQIGGQIQAGFYINGLYEDNNLKDDQVILDLYIPFYIATRAIKPHRAWGNN